MMKKKLRSVWLATALLLCCLSVSQSAVPETLTYQGKLTNSSGSPVNGTVSIVFAIYGASTGGTALWTETQSSVSVSSGIFTVTLGSVTPIPSTVFSNTDLYLGIKVGADSEMALRQKLNSVPFAIRAKEADSITSGGSVPSGFMILGDSSTPPAGYTYTGETVGLANQWFYKQKLPQGRVELAAASVNGKVYAIGGDNSTVLSTIEEYDPATNAWAAKTSMPTARASLAAAVVNNKIYVIGGFNATYLATVEEYDPTSDTWTTKAPMPTARQGIAASVVNGKIYVIGGSNGTYLSTVEEYDPSTNTWTTKSPMPTARDYLAAAAVNNKIYAIGGYGTGYLSTVEEYDPASNTWTTKTSMAVARGYFAAAAVNNKVYALGGCNLAGCNDAITIEIYDPSGNSWINGPSFNERRAGHAAISVNDRIYVIASSWGNADTVEELNTKTYYVHRKD